MAMIYKPLEIKDSDGCFRMCATSDQDESVMMPLCECEGGHTTAYDARHCEIVKEKLAKLFPDTTPGVDITELPVKDIRVVTARVAHEVNRAFCEFLGDDSQPPWVDAPNWQKSSAVVGAAAIIRNPDLGHAATHEGWLAQKEADGWVYGETKDPEAKTHPCMVPFSELPRDQKFKDVLFCTVVKAVMEAVG